MTSLPNILFCIRYKRKRQKRREEKKKNRACTKTKKKKGRRASKPRSHYYSTDYACANFTTQRTQIVSCYKYLILKNYFFYKNIYFPVLYEMLAVTLSQWSDLIDEESRARHYVHRLHIYTYTLYITRLLTFVDKNEARWSIEIVISIWRLMLFIQVKYILIYIYTYYLDQKRFPRICSILYVSCACVRCMNVLYLRVHESNCSVCVKGRKEEREREREREHERSHDNDVHKRGAFMLFMNAYVTQVIYLFATKDCTNECVSSEICGLDTIAISISRADLRLIARGLYKNVEKSDFSYGTPHIVWKICYITATHARVLYKLLIRNHLWRRLTKTYI